MRALLPLSLLTLAGVSGQDWQLAHTIPLHALLHHVQGIDVEGDSLWVSSVDRATRQGWLSRFELPSGKLLRQVEVQAGERFHPGGITLDGDAVWVPVAEYRRASSSTVQRRDKSTLALLSYFDVPDHIGCIAAGADFLIGGNWDSRKLYRWSKSGQLLRSDDNPRPTAYQDVKIVDGALVGSGIVTPKSGAVEWLSLDGQFRLLRRVEMGVTDRGTAYTHEGMTLRNGRLYLLPEDDPSRLFVFEPTR